MTKKIYAAATVVLTALASCSPFWSESLIGVQATIHAITPPPTSQPAKLKQPSTKAD
jgi:hypothetical protein